MPVIYKATNLINNKVYIGQTVYSLKQRLNDAPYGHYYIVFGENKLNIKLNMFLHKALHKYGKDNFKFEVIEEQYFDDVNDRDNWLNEREIYWIAYYRSNQKEFGYNQTTGGHKHYHRTKECREKISRATKEAMSRLNTKELCNPMKNMTEKEKVVHKQNISVNTKKAMNNPEIRNRMLVNHKIAINKDSYKLNRSRAMKGKIPWNKNKKMDDVFKEKCRNANIGRRWLTNGTSNHWVKDINVIQSYINEGYYYGKTIIRKEV